LATAIGNSGTDVGNIKYLLDTGKASTGTVPRAYVNWILFDEQFNPVKSGSSFDPINTNPDNVKTHHNQVSIGTSGYLYVYCSNESNNDVYFDNLQVIQTRGPLLETSNYYPFGLEMAGITSKSANKIGNKYKFNKGSELANKEFSDGSGLEMYETHFRMLDPQLGRWWQIDPKSENGIHDISPYSTMHNNPFLINDPFGDFDDYKLMQDGKIEFVKKTDDKTTDKLYATDTKGEVNKDKSITVQKGILNNVQSGIVVSKKDIVNYNFMEVKGAEATKLFKFLAKNSNVEWSLSKFDNGRDFISTSHLPGTEPGSNGILTNTKLNLGGAKLIEADHSHPGGVQYPSGRMAKGVTGVPGDITNSRWVESLYPGQHIRFNIYTPSDGKFTPYNSSTEDVLKEVFVTPKKKD
jgi:RHS repeat-associated protein